MDHSTRAAGAEIPEAGWLRGYQRSLAGEILAYHSPYPDSETSLLVRATDGKKFIEWETAAVPADVGGKAATFVWMCGVATKDGAHEFLLSVNGRPVLTFNTCRNPSERSWTVTGRDGAKLIFRATMIDQFDELFGFMWLQLPATMVTPGMPVVIRVAGEKGESVDWFMVFEYDLRSWIRASGEEVLARRDERLVQFVRVEISHLGPPRTVTLSAMRDRGVVSACLEVGYNIFHLDVDAVDEEKAVDVSIVIEGDPARIEHVVLRPVRKREIHLLPHSHLDIGYSDPQPIVERKHWSYFEQAIELSRKSAHYPKEARFKWNVENLWAVESYLRQASPERRDSFIQAVRDGAIGLQALIANELTGVCHPEELLRLTEFARRLSEHYGLEINSAMVTDIPSYTWSLVPALALGGVKYLSSGPNYMPRLPDGGDRIGYAMKTWGDRPFYWVSASDAEKLLLWMTGRGYSWFHGLNTGKLGSAARRSIFDYMRELRDRDYPYSMVQVRYTIGGDNGPPDPGLSDFVRAWNEEFESPRFAITTSQAMFDEFEKRYGNLLPEVRGDFTPYWEDGVASTARETAINRRTAETLLQAQALWAMLRPGDYPAAEFNEAWRQVMLFDEHTWGAADSVSDPDGENARAQWAWKEALAATGKRLAGSLLQSAIGGSDAPGVSREQEIDVINTRSWLRTEVVQLSPEMSAAGDLVVDDAGRPVPSQRLSSGGLAILATDVPPFGVRRYRVRSGAAFQAERARAQAHPPCLENARLRVLLDGDTGAVSSLVLKGGSDREFVDRSAGLRVNAYFYVPGRTPSEARGVHRARIRVKEEGPLVVSLIVESDAPGCRSLITEYSVLAGLDFVCIKNVLDKEKIREKESAHFAFPFMVPGGSFRLDLGWALIRPEEDQIPGSCKDFFCVHNTVDLSTSAAGITFVSLDAPLVEIGQMTDESLVAKGTRAWRLKIDPKQILFSYAMNNYWHTNYKADQEGLVELHYALRPHAGRGSSEVKMFGMERSQPLVVRMVKEGSWPAAPLLEIDGEGVLATFLAPLKDGSGWVIRLYNAAEHPRTVRFGGVIGRECRLYRSDLDETRFGVCDGAIGIPACGILTLRAERGV